MEKGKATCTVEELESILTASSGGIILYPTEEYNEVIPNIYIGGMDIAKNSYHLKRLGVTHVLNTAVGPKDKYHVNTNELYYKRSGLKFMGIKCTDIMNCKIAQYFKPCAEYIEEALTSGGKVLIHCREGRSRSATIAIAFVMLKRRMVVQDAIRLIRETREIYPNPGFLQQLCDLNDRLFKEGHFVQSMKVS